MFLSTDLVVWRVYCDTVFICLYHPMCMYETRLDVWMYVWIYPLILSYTCLQTTKQTQAAEINLVGCQFGPKDAALWKKTGQMFLELGRPFFLKAQYCFGRAIKVCASVCLGLYICVYVCRR